MDNAALAEFLRARRALVRPKDVGLDDAAADARRRVTGLRREELALLAGVSATVTSRRMNVVGSNALTCEPAPCYVPGTNLLRAVFLDPGTRDTHVDWNAAASEAVANFRARIGIERDDPELTELIGELSLRVRDDHSGFDARSPPSRSTEA